MYQHTKIVKDRREYYVKWIHYKPQISTKMSKFQKIHIGFLAGFLSLFCSCIEKEPPIPFYLFILKEGDYIENKRYIAVDSNGYQYSIHFSELEGIFYYTEVVNLPEHDMRKLLDAPNCEEKCYYDEKTNNWLYVPRDKVDDYLIMDDPIERRFELPGDKVHRNQKECEDEIRPYIIQIKKIREETK